MKYLLSATALVLLASCTDKPDWCWQTRHVYETCEELRRLDPTVDCVCESQGDEDSTPVLPPADDDDDDGGHDPCTNPRCGGGDDDDDDDGETGCDGGHDPDCDGVGGEPVRRKEN